MQNADEVVKRRREHVALVSRERRAKKKQLVESLRETNAKLKEERAQFIAKIKQLESQVENRMSTSDVQAIAENSALRLEIEMHKRFIESFTKLAQVPSSLIGQRALCREGAESAQAYVQGLLAESQTAWAPLEMPPGMPMPLDDFALHYCFRENLFGAAEEGPGVRRFNLRLDMAFPGVDAQRIATYYWDLYKSPDEQQRCFGLRAVELEQVDMPDSDTRLLYNRKTWNTPQHHPSDKSYSDTDQDIVYICSRRNEDMPRSSLRPPRTAGAGTSEAGDSTCSQLSASANPNQGAMGDPYLGKAQVTTIAMTSTRSTHETLRSYAIESKCGPSICEAEGRVHHIKSVIAQGAICWNEEHTDSGRLTCVISYPEEFRWLDFSFADVVDENGQIGLRFAGLLCSIAARLHEVMYKAPSPALPPAPQP